MLRKFFKKDAETRFFELVNKYGLETDDHYMFYQFGNEDLVPMQGIKVHVSAGGKDINSHLEEYVSMLEKLVPQLVAENAVFKVASPQLAAKWILMNSIQKGKLITIYESPFNAMEFFEKNANELYEKSGIRIPNDKHIRGRVHIRYGNFKREDGTVVNPNTGFHYKDDRNSGYVPPFIQEIHLLDFIHGCENRRRMIADF